MLVTVFDWSYAGTDVFIPCPTCKSLRVVERDALDRDHCVYLDCCGGTTVRLSGSELIAPMPTVVA